ncbi:MAG: glycine cleavage system protein T [Rhodospirillales bacterium RIFCSPLOWO2_01_FULL_65_14]|nr:MAG: glycine cleavage system protein T [Rhodospirillales bacterium RIFCSPLOWO2_01_FULL_65_14]
MDDPRRYAILEDRGILAVGGEDRVTFLQGLVSNDVTKVEPRRAVYAAFLTPRGKYLHDFFIFDHAGEFLLDCERARLADLMKRLSIYKLRAKVTVVDRSNTLRVAALIGAGWRSGLGLGDEPGDAAAFTGGVVAVDPRLAEAGGRAVVPKDGAEAALTAAGFARGDAAEYDRLRLTLGLPDGSRDLVADKSILLESGFDELNGVDWQKGCYMGQELTARTKYRGLVKKRLMPVTFAGPPPAPGTPVMLDGREAGETRSVAKTPEGGLGLALMRLDALEGGAEGKAFTAADVPLKVVKPAWAAF